MPARAGLDRGAVVRAAAEILDEKGKPDITLAELAARLGVRTPSLYNHVAGLEDLMRAIGLYGVQELGQRIGRAAIGKAGPDAIVSICHAYRAFAHERPGLYLTSVGAPTDDEPDRVAASDEIIGILRLVLEPFGQDAKQQIHSIRVIRSLVHGFVSLELSGGFGLPIDVDQSFDYLLEMLTAGLQHDARARQ